MSFLLVVRRTHLYLGLALLPWVFMFGVSSLILNHPSWRPPETELWQKVIERDYAVAVPASGDLRPSAAHIIKDLDYDASGGFGVYWTNPRRLTVNLPNFIHPVRISYLADQNRLLVERRAFAWVPTLANMHTHDGYYLHSPGQTAWGATVDVVCVAIVFWIASGLYMWWYLPGRGWGWIALASGLGSFGWLMARL